MIGRERTGILSPNHVRASDPPFPKADTEFELRWMMTEQVLAALNGSGCIG
jgi:hypothetical protein